MKRVELYEVAFIFGLFVGVVAVAVPSGKFKDPTDIKRVVLECDTDKSGELSTDEFNQCVRYFSIRYRSLQKKSVFTSKIQIP